ncbi:ABC-F family ATP-binding cassette domain-containing protein [Leucobacter musarum]|uniref:ABC-F family ATP-binding cassette domain-containing protein n=1 Tax=Leucobacter musarum TaxID=1930747 RepID=UPI0006A75C05|nr:ATP-binding cassette domain-containing protein [Leucobacter musarum]
MSPSAVTLHAVSHAWPDGSASLVEVSGTFPEGRTGLIGRNGAGKSTLLKLIAGDLAPASGVIDVAGDVATLPQTLTLHGGTTIAELLGIAPTLAGLRAIEAGDVDVRHFDAVGDDWDIESRADEALGRIGFSARDLDRRVAEVSGGESMLIAITGLRLRRAAVTLLDEPTNNLDRATRARLGEFIVDWPGTVIVVSHDLELLERMDHTAELYDGALTTFGGPYSAWREHRDHEQAAAVQAARAAQQVLQTEKRQRVETETKLARRERTARKVQLSGSLPKILAGKRANAAQVSAGALRGTMDGKVDAAQAAVDAADARVRDDRHISLVLPDPELAKGRRVIEFVSGERSFVVQGPERVALIGANGSGKSTLLAQLLRGDEGPSDDDAQGGRPTARLLTERVGYLPQRLDALDDRVSALENVRTVAPGVPAGTIRNGLARLLLRGSAADRPVSTLSGGERFRASLARLLFADPPAQLLVLDEPTNNLDLESVEHLAEALDAYRGALLVVSHDVAFLSRISVDTVLELEAGELRRLGELPGGDRAGAQAAG